MWQYSSAQSFESYKQNLLKGNKTLAKHDLKEAIKYAKSSADLSQLASIYLGKCALNKALGREDNCKEFKKIEPLITSIKLKNYYLFIQKDIDAVDTEYLPTKYQDFAKALQNGNTKRANEVILQIEDPISQMITLSLLDKKATKRSLKTTLQNVSFYGYKEGVLYLLKELLKKEKNPTKRAVIKQKLTILSQ